MSTLTQHKKELLAAIDGLPKYDQTKEEERTYRRIEELIDSYDMFDDDTDWVARERERAENWQEQQEKYASLPKHEFKIGPTTYKVIKHPDAVRKFKKMAQAMGTTINSPTPKVSMPKPSALPKAGNQSLESVIDICSDFCGDIMQEYEVPRQACGAVYATNGYAIIKVTHKDASKEGERTDKSTIEGKCEYMLTTHGMGIRDSAIIDTLSACRALQSMAAVAEKTGPHSRIRITETIGGVTFYLQTVTDRNDLEEAQVDCTAHADPGFRSSVISYENAFKIFKSAARLGFEAVEVSIKHEKAKKSQDFNCPLFKAENGSTTAQWAVAPVRVA